MNKLHGFKFGSSFSLTDAEVASFSAKLDNLLLPASDLPDTISNLSKADPSAPTHLIFALGGQAVEIIPTITARMTSSINPIVVVFLSHQDTFADLVLHYNALESGDKSWKATYKFQLVITADHLHIKNLKTNDPQTSCFLATVFTSSKKKLASLCDLAPGNNESNLLKGVVLPSVCFILVVQSRATQRTSHRGLRSVAHVADYAA